MQRRTFLASGLILPSALATAAGSQSSLSALPAEVKFALSLKADAIGVNGTADELLAAAIKHGYGALSIPAQWVEGWTDKKKAAFADKARKNNIAWGANGLPVEFRKSESQFKADLGALPVHAKNLADIGVTRIGTWIVSGHDQLTYNENMKQHADRLRDAARILGQHGIQLGLEYLGTPSIRHNARFAFISTGKELREMIALIGEPNVGVILDSYHWYTAQESVEDLMQWKNEEIVAVDLNDANAQLKLIDQTDVARELPGATGVIDLAGFIRALVKIGYDGPVRAEPFNSTLNQMDNELAIAATFHAVKSSVEKALD
ncbi:sugar phosphate isomerase/epimerase family protein [Neolewinella agarilytica]|uniref:Sugar phosphate isomerase/epimerase n=1 Tax=Neolewinella agarilytica TaxID=478744 RepID=A0A1H8YXS3_9BACT|nr:sugar phosphate isomerase/epimerase family protein [Neolewinella agarilytica]SEP56861.1 Sugar phosphate isomerase/epimerase [Neolewinella agarilytica]